MKINPHPFNVASSYYDEGYFNWQKNIGVFGGWANAYKFKSTVTKGDTVIDFGCGGGFLLKSLVCSKRIGIEPNQSAFESIAKLGIRHFLSPTEVRNELGEEFADVIISNNVLEHTLNPLQELLNLKPLLRSGGTIHFFVPCDSINYSYDANDINHHLYSWSPQNIGNLFKEAGYEVQYSRPYIHKWPPYYKKIAKLGWVPFNIACRIYGRLNRSWFQVEVKAKKL